ncbi:hypothetical protein GALMADRAFT_59618 [Galerina marginata CBS 339.88]|uniref:DNA 3'-5' helicase n=1 Tax=Galerina marginata (strain CBS 339.88) TaxID=685588 RepID=A0A067TEU0_GALM3|nr:hypothetical protein GALMADRAFT_59618 [Galerina marginata CBS 339.88]
MPQPNPRNAHGIRLRPVSELPDVYKGIFKFGVFNAVQSTCFDEVNRLPFGIFRRQKSCMLLGIFHRFLDLLTQLSFSYYLAPTGSGKTVLFELAIIRMVERSKISGKQVKCVYIAPTKALCSEKFQDWVTKFEPIGLKCCEMTGDTVVIGQNTWGDAKNASIMFCEKWDSLTRNWHDHDRILSQIQLFLVDEVHILNESRGSTLEVVTSRMKLRANMIRFILVSATVPNIQDVACWIGSGSGTSEAAQVFEFGDAYRPCQLTRHVVGVYRRNGYNDFQFAKVLDFKLFSVLQQFSVGKPILVFCSTRKGVFDSAGQLMKEYTDTEGRKASLPWSRPARIAHLFNDKRLDELACAGIGVHHAGISMDDRRATEQLYLKKVLRVLVATSTLAVGVNLPAHMVVIKGVRTFQNNASKEYSDLDVMQMLGRAGRPQFDKEGIAVILCESELENKYKALVQGKTILESSLHSNLAEHLNSEIGLGTITDVGSAKSWLRNSFLYQRMQKNPKYYALGPVDTQNSGEDLDNVVMESISQLKKTLLIDHVETGEDVGKLSSTQYGEIMSRYYIRRATASAMDIILALPGRASLREIVSHVTIFSLTLSHHVGIIKLESICGAEEYAPRRQTEGFRKKCESKTHVYNTLKKDTEIRFEVKKVEKTTDKVFLLVQAVLGGISLNSAEYRSPDSQPHMEAFTVFKHISRISRAALEVAVVKKDGLQMKNGFELFRCLSSKAWEDRAIVFRQIEQIGEKSIKVLAENGITSFVALRKQTPLRIETLLNRRHPFGLEVLASVADFPQYVLRIKETAVRSDGGESPVKIDLLVECGLTEEVVASFKPKKQRNRAFQMTAVLTLTSDMELIDLRRIPTKSLKSAKAFEVTAELKKPSQSVIIIVTSETIAGVALQHVYKPSVPASEYPTLDTRPISSVDMDLVGLDDDPDFWNMELGTSDKSEHFSTSKVEGS